VAATAPSLAEQLFHAAPPGTAADNDSWIRRKTAVVNRFGHSTLLVRQSFLERGTTFEAATGLDPEQLEDHRMVVAALRAQTA
jgi:uncharacterized protein (UPF0303 family)